LWIPETPFPFLPIFSTENLTDGDYLLAPPAKSIFATDCGQLRINGERHRNQFGDTPGVVSNCGLHDRREFPLTLRATTGSY
jgi:hypothetical protein